MRREVKPLQSRIAVYTSFSTIQIIVGIKSCISRAIHQRDAMEISYEAVFRSLTGVAQATKASPDEINTIGKLLSPDNEDTETKIKPASLSFLNWQVIIRQNVTAMTGAAIHIALVAVAVSLLRETARQNQPATADEINQCWTIIHNALTSTTSSRAQFTASRSAQGFLSVPLCSLVKDGSIDELIRLHIWMPDGKCYGLDPISGSKPQPGYYYSSPRRFYKGPI
ncbi:uncharacterized protein BDZ83DRAFT_635025 [Colletotrichum acutatum]|uniref:Uncharacterized protein n=1 Tax=Glomerella acutata TaxID=27357 RepID=A0AAD8UFT3_GLOAC|nr:uncharacterized protein BDZ83DRAFT_635025 [Colletotrichum acutatum]KAK1716150.1 hypothetical protein BDZ83DRAFT_635025 [Colletotrichum acutatum]